jgi:drug/metabolite transporter (DMT)-like permease
VRRPGSQRTWQGLAALSSGIYGTIPILAKVGYSAGLQIDQMLALRFGLAAAIMSVAVLAVGGLPAGVSPRQLLILVLLGAIGYGGQTLLFFTALRSLPAGQTELIAYAYPALVAVGAWLLYRRPMRRAKLVLLVLSVVGVALLLGDVALHPDALLLLAAVQPFGIAAYLLVTERLLLRTPPLVAGYFIVLGAAVFWISAAALDRQLGGAENLTAWLVIGALALGPSVIAIPLNLFGLAVIGSDRVALVGAVEPLVTVALAALLLGETFGWLQGVGAVLVVGTVVALQSGSSLWRLT